MGGNPMRIGRSTDMTQGTIWKQLLSFAAPMLLGLIFQQMYNTVDSIVVGNYVSSQALAAVGATGAFVQLLLGVFVGLCSGAGVLVAQSYGAGDREAVDRQVHTALRWSSPAPTARGTVSPCTMRCTPPS